MLCDLTSGVLPSPNETDGVASVTGRNSRYLSINPEFVNEKNAPDQAEPKLAYYRKDRSPYVSTRSKLSN